MKAYRAYRPVPAESSWTLFEQGLDHIPFEWHYNSEFELTLTLNSRGQRFIGESFARCAIFLIARHGRLASRARFAAKRQS